MVSGLGEEEEGSHAQAGAEAVRQRRQGSPMRRAVARAGDGLVRAARDPVKSGRLSVSPHPSASSTERNRAACPKTARSFACDQSLNDSSFDPDPNSTSAARLHARAAEALARGSGAGVDCTAEWKAALRIAHPSTLRFLEETTPAGQNGRNHDGSVHRQASTHATMAARPRGRRQARSVEWNQQARRQ